MQIDLLEIDENEPENVELIDLNNDLNLNPVQSSHNLNKGNKHTNGNALNRSKIGNYNN